MANEKKRKITIKLKRGLMGCKSEQKATVVGLGLSRRGTVSTLENTPAVRGMVKKVIHLLDIVSET
jgi:large subunit ribosomal protein L30